ncbi:MAG: PEP-CTERM sorting domain-containing protein [bacterium]|nr:PEP-CTERM sorting domain-containing protein [bacterium]
MKKLLTLALAVLGFTVAQAVTISWTNTSANYNATGTKIKDENTNGSVGKYSLAALITYNSAPTSTAEVLQIQQWSSGSSYLYAYGSDSAFGNGKNGATMGAEKKGGGGNYWLTANDYKDLLPNVGDTFLAVFTWEDGANGNVKITSWVDGITWEFQSETTASNLNLIVNSNDAWTVNEIVAYEGLLTDAEITAMSNAKTANVNNVPEPTVLALLALGVAGVALKRKKVVA